MAFHSWALPSLLWLIYDGLVFNMNQNVGGPKTRLCLASGHFDSSIFLEKDFVLVIHLVPN